MIKALLEASPSLLYDRDAQTGNTALHAALYKTPLMGLLALRRNELDLNARNLSGQTPLHIHSHREDVGCVITMVSYDIDLNARDNNGNTPLHIVVSVSIQLKSDITAFSRLSGKLLYPDSTIHNHLFN